MTSTHRGDPAARRTALILLAIIGVAGAVLILASTTLRPALEDWVRGDVRSRLTIVIAVAMVIAAGPPLGLAAYLWQFGGRVIREQRFPPSDTRLIQDASITTGHAAVRRGRAMRVFSAGIAISALLIVATLLRFALLVQRAAG
jgi:hypothetical protein